MSKHLGVEICIYFSQSSALIRACGALAHPHESLISLEISKELDQQNKMLDNVNQDFEEAITGLDAVTKKTKDLIKKSGERYGGLILLNSNRPAGRGDTLICKIFLILILY